LLANVGCGGREKGGYDLVLYKLGHQRKKKTRHKFVLRFVPAGYCARDNKGTGKKIEVRKRGEVGKGTWTGAVLIEVGGGWRDACAWGTRGMLVVWSIRRGRVLIGFAKG